MSVMTLNAMDFEELEMLQAPSLFGSIFHAVVTTVKVAYQVVEKTVVIVTAWQLYSSS